MADFKNNMDINVLLSRLQEKANEVELMQARAKKETKISEEAKKIKYEVDLDDYRKKGI